MVMTQNFKAFNFETKIVLTDDNELFLKTLNYKLSDHYQIVSFSNPNLALEYIISNYKDNLVTNNSCFVIDATDDEELDDNYYSVEFSKIKSLAENPEKNKTITVIIVDYSMPLMNGVEFCEKIAHLPVLKIMLTGHADFNIAIDAFNRGIIDKFLVKDSPNMLAAISESINSMQNAFFEKQSLPLLNCLVANKNTVINTIEYKNHFAKVVNTLNALEYYILDVLGSYLIISENRQHYYFMVLLDMQLDAFVDVAKNSRVAPNLLKKIESKTHAPIFLKESDYKISALKWNKLLHPIKKMNGYYYSLVPKTIP